MKTRNIVLAVALTGLSSPALAERACTDLDLVTQAIDTAKENTSPLFGKITVLDYPYNMRDNPYFGTRFSMADPGSILADRDAQCVANVVTNHGKMTMYYGWETIHEKSYVSVKMVPNLGLDKPASRPLPAAPAAPEGPPAPAPVTRWADVLPQVRQHCASEWATDFQMQAYCVEQQRLGWEKLNAGQPPSPAVMPPTPPPTPAPVFVQPSAPVPAPSAPTTSATITLVEQTTTRLVLDYNAYWSQGGTNVENLSQYYASQVTFYGGAMTREKVMDEKRKFSVRWPIRHFTVTPNSLFVQCGSDGTCTATGIVAWDCTSQERGEHSVGTANFVYRMVNGVIVSENGSVLTGHKDKI